MTIKPPAGWARLCLAALAALALLGLGAGRGPVAAGEPRLLVVAPDGKDANPGALAAPWRTLTHAFQQLRPGDTLLVRGGEYRERVILTGSDLTASTPELRITIRAYVGEEPVVRGLLWLSNASYWTIDNLDVTWDDTTGSSGEHMMRFFDGEGFIYQHSELSGARSYAALLIDGGARGWNLNHLFAHDTHPSNGLSQDHLIYIASASDGIIERCLLVNSTNGRGVKLGTAGGGSDLPARIVVRHNTIVNSGSGNVAFSNGARDNQVYRNILVNAGNAYPSVWSWNLYGTNNVARDNVTFGSVAAVTDKPGVVDGGNLVLDPLLDGSFVPTNVALQDAAGVLGYGHLTGLDLTPEPEPEPEPAEGGASVHDYINPWIPH